MWLTPPPEMDVSVFTCIAIVLHLSDVDAATRYGESGSKLRVTSVLVEPYLMRNWDYNNKTTSSERPYVGFVADLVDKLSQIAGFRYQLTHVADGSYGYRQADGTWDGMVGELLSGRAEMAAAPMYVTSHRASVVDFTEPYMTVHATVLLRKAPAGATVKIRSVDELINQSEIKYGTLDRGVILRAFKRTNETEYKMMWRHMQRFDERGSKVLTATNEEGIEMVRREKYGFVLPNTIGEYISMREPCDLVTVGRFLLNRGYALAVQKNSDHLERINKALRMLKDSGYLDGLYRKWWIGRSECNGIRSSKIYSTSHSHRSSSVVVYLGLLFSVVHLLSRWISCS